MPQPTLLVQLSDIHIGGDEEGLDPIPRLEAVIEAVRTLPNRPDAVLVSGDLSDDGSAEGYRLVREMLARLEVPLHVIPGNHDDRRRLREAFDLPGTGDEPINYCAEVGELRLIAFDSIVPEQDPGDFPPEWRTNQNRRFGDIFMLADPGWEFVGTKPVNAVYTLGEHGYDPATPEMMGVFLASGPSFQRGVRLAERENRTLHELLIRLLRLKNPIEAAMPEYGLRRTP